VFKTDFPDGYRHKQALTMATKEFGDIIEVQSLGYPLTVLMEREFSSFSIQIAFRHGSKSVDFQRLLQMQLNQQCFLTLVCWRTVLLTW
jgi:hypothetical protein